MPKKTVTPTISFGGRIKPEFIRTKQEFINIAVSVSNNSISSGRLDGLVAQLLVQKYSDVRDMLEGLFDGMTDEQIQTAVNNHGWAFGIKA